jgi:hypothetical protein
VTCRPGNFDAVSNRDGTADPSNRHSSFHLPDPRIHDESGSPSAAAGSIRMRDGLVVDG